MTDYTTIKLRRGSAAQWAATNPTLALGEYGYETDTRKSKVGDGLTAWNSLAYVYGTPTATGNSVATAADAAAARTAIGAERLATFNVKDYGAVGNGTADDTTAIQSAIDAAVAAGGGQVLLDAGTYKVTSSLILGSNVSIIGCGPQSVIKAGAVITCLIKNDYASGNSNISLRNFTLDRSASQHGILVNGVTNFLADGLEITADSSTVGGVMSFSGVGPTTRLLSKNIRVVNCVFTNSRNFGVHAGYVDGMVMSNNTAYETFREIFGVEPYSATTSKNIVISNNTVVGSITVTGTQTGIIVITESSGGTIEGVTISGNTLRMPEAGDTENPGILVAGGESITITGNAIYGCDGHGMLIGNADLPTEGVVIQGNSIVDCGRTSMVGEWAGIKLRYGRRTTVTGNYIYGTNHDYGILEDTGCNNNLIALNNLRDTVPVSTVVYNAGTVIFANKAGTGSETVTFGSAGALNNHLNFDRANTDSTENRIQFMRNSVLRWFIRNSGAESGSNAGSNIEFGARTDAGGAIGTALTLTRSDLSATFGGKVTVSGVLELGNSSDTTISRVSAGQIAVEGVSVPLNSTTSTHTAQQVELGHASDTTISRTSAGQIAVEGNPVGIKVAVPASASATGVVGQWAADSSWFYVCTAANTWVRSALASW